VGLIGIANETIFFLERGKEMVRERFQGTKRVSETFPFPLRGRKVASSPCHHQLAFPGMRDRIRLLRLRRVMNMRGPCLVLVSLEVDRP